VRDSLFPKIVSIIATAKIVAAAKNITYTTLHETTGITGSPDLDAVHVGALEAEHRKEAGNGCRNGEDTAEEVLLLPEDKIEVRTEDAKKGDGHEYRAVVELRIGRKPTEVTGAERQLHEAYECPQIQ
jgi:hypothetical protein